MYKLTVILHALIISAGSLTDLHDLAKLPYLLEHYDQHKSKVDEFSFAEFLNLHYGNKAAEHDKEEHEQHKGLPFKAPDHSSLHSTICLIEKQSTSLHLESSSIAYNNFYQATFPAGFYQSIFQPPRKA